MGWGSRAVLSAAHSNSTRAEATTQAWFGFYEADVLGSAVHLDGKCSCTPGVQRQWGMLDAPLCFCPSERCSHGQEARLPGGPGVAEACAFQETEIQIFMWKPSLLVFSQVHLHFRDQSIRNWHGCLSPGLAQSWCTVWSPDQIGGVLMRAQENMEPGLCQVR